MFYLSRRQAHAALAGVGAALAYLAAAETGSRRPVRTGGLILLSTVSLAGMATVKSSAKAKAIETRLNAHVVAAAPAINLQANGGQIGGTLHVTGNHNVDGLASLNGGINTNGAVIDSGNANISTGSGNVNCTDLNSSGTQTCGHIVMTGNINMSGHTANSVGGGHAAGYT
jgi:hypothetical protein